MTENSAANGLENPTEKCLERMQRIGCLTRERVLGLLERPSQYIPLAAKPRPINWKYRDHWIQLCLMFGLNAREISDFSLSWPQKIGTVTQVYDKVESLGLGRAYLRARKLRAGHHSKNIAFAFTKLCGQAMEHGHDVADVDRDKIPEDGMRFRPDFAFRVDDKFQFYVEVQLSRIIHTRWTTKFRNYVTLYRKTKNRFRVLFIVDRAGDITRMRQYARDVLRDAGVKRSLFLFITVDSLQAYGDLWQRPVWKSEWDNRATTLL